MTKKDYYEILGLGRNAAKEEIKSAYKSLAKKYHPDVSKEENSAEKFKEVLEAYNVLSDEQKRSNYDRFGHAAEGFSAGQGSAGFDFRDFDFENLFSGFGGFSGFGDLFKGGFGQGAGRRGPERGSNLRFDLGISFDEAAFGTEKEVSFERLGKCDVCNGVGGKGRGKCDVCQGRGVEVTSRRTPFGIFQTQTSCGSCQGTGEVIKDKCKKCKGRGIVREERKIKVKVPAGIDSGNHLRLREEGNYGSAGYGNLFVIIFVEPHKQFRRGGSDIFVEIDLSFADAALGATIDVPTLKGKAKLKVPSGTQTGTIFKMKGQGIKEVNSSRIGDEYIKVIVKTPEKLSKKEKEIFQKLKEHEKKGSKGFWNF